MTNMIAKWLVQLSGIILAFSLCFGAASSAAAEIPSQAVEDPPLFNLEEIKSGMTGVGYSVFSSLEGLESFEFVVLGVMRDYLGPGEDLIVARLKGKRFEHSGVVAGMSGSPAYIDGRLVGAVAYGFGEFTQDPIAGITPIKGMLRARVPRESPIANQKAWDTAHPISLPLVGQGLAPSVAQYFEPILKSRGYGKLMPSAGRAGESASGTKRFYAGGPIAAMIVEGDMNISAIGTVTWVKGDEFLAFGHPFLQTGKSELPVADADIVTTVFSEQFSYKMGQPTVRLGALTDDRNTAIAGSMSKVAQMTTLGVKFGDRQWNFKVAYHPRDTPMFAAIALANLFATRIERELGGTYHLVIRVGLSSGEKISVERDIAANAEAMETPLAMAFWESLTPLVNQDLKDVTIANIDVDVARVEKVKLASLESVQIDTRLFPGAKARARIALKPWKAKSTQRVVDFQVPLGLETGDYKLVVGDRSSSLALEQASGLFQEPQNYEMLLKQIQHYPKDTELCLYLERPLPSQRLSGYAMTGLPSSLRKLTSGIALAPEANLAKSALRLTCVDVGQVVSGMVMGDVSLLEKPKR